MFLAFSLLVALSVVAVHGFSSPLIPTEYSRRASLFSSGSDELDSMRQMLDASWDTDTMGQVPSDAVIAANEAFSSILTASDRGIGVYFVDLLLPTYDITQGSNLYDEVLAVEYCIALADCFNGKSSILVRDNDTIETVSRILDAREKERQQSASDKEEATGDEYLTDEDESKLDGEVNSDTKSDFSESSNAEEDVDSFRQKLMSSWEGSDVGDPNFTKGRAAKDPAPAKAGAEKTAPTQVKRYRLASMFGSARILDGPDVMEKVVEAIRANALPTDDEENLIVLSAITREEMIAVRSLVAKYDGKRKIILVNCKLTPIPKELFAAETVYSILPLVAKQEGADPQAGSSSNQVPPKVVLLRRYPRDWQVFVDMGGGFQLAKTAPSDFRNKRGPPMEWVGKAVQKFLESQ